MEAPFPKTVSRCDHGLGASSDLCLNRHLVYKEEEYTVWLAGAFALAGFSIQQSITSISYMQTLMTLQVMDLQCTLKQISANDYLIFTI